VHLAVALGCYHTTNTSANATSTLTLLLSGTVISDAVNLASRIEGMTKVFGCRMIVSRETLQRALDGTGTSGAPFDYRYLGDVVVKGRALATSLFEVIENDDASKQVKLQSRASFEEAVALYQQGQYNEAQTLFRALSLAPTGSIDPAVAYYVLQVAKQLQHSSP
jgi:hypothetical protein